MAGIRNAGTGISRWWVRKVLLVLLNRTPTTVVYYFRTEVGSQTGTEVRTVSWVL